MRTIEAPALPGMNYREPISGDLGKVIEAVEMCHRVGDHSQEAGNMLLPAIGYLERARARGVCFRDECYAEEVSRQCRKWLASSARSYEDSRRPVRGVA